jgi:uncharacterized protein (TIGR04255 family)
LRREQGHFTLYFTIAQPPPTVTPMDATPDPLVSPPPAEVPLTNAPLVRVIAQLRFPEILSVEQGDFVAPFQEAIRATYGVLRKEQTLGFVMGPSGPLPGKPQLAWRFTDTDGNWRVSLTPEFLALETTKYTSRSDFLRRLQLVVAAVVEHIAPSQIDRLGVRYIDRITGADVDDLNKLVRPEVCGISGTNAAGHAVHSLSESVFTLPEAGVTARWGRIPPGATVDPAAVEPVDEKSWILDLDMYSSRPMPFVVKDVLAKAESYSERIYAIFRWAVTKDFLVRFGGKP